MIRLKIIELFVMAVRRSNNNNSVTTKTAKPNGGESIDQTMVKRCSNKILEQNVISRTRENNNNYVYVPNATYCQIQKPLSVLRYCVIIVILVRCTYSSRQNRIRLNFVNAETQNTILILLYVCYIAAQSLRI